MKLRFFEWAFLLCGLAAIDTFIWMSVNGVVYQAYENWAFEQTLRGGNPSPARFAAAEARGLFKRPRRDAAISIPQPPEPRDGRPVPAPPRDGLIGRLTIPRLHVAVMVREGDDEGTLSRAAGHIPGTALPGRAGNVGVAAHRDTFFRPLRKIRNDDTIQMQTLNGTYRYVVKSTRIVGPEDVSVLASSGRQTLTLVTCYPFYYVGGAPKRFVVQAALVTPQTRPQTVRVRQRSLPRGS